MRVGDRVEPAGEWPDAEVWVHGDVIEATGFVVTIRTQSGKHFTCSRNRITYKPRAAAFVVWPMWVAAEIDAIERHEREADRRRSPRNKALVEGEYVLVRICDDLIGCCVTHADGAGFLCSILPSRQALPALRTWMVTPQMLEWCETRRCWIAEYSERRDVG